MRFELSVTACLLLTIIVSDGDGALAEGSEPCPPAVILSGNSEQRASVALELAVLGVFSESIPSGCPAIRATIEDESGGLRVTIEAHGRRAARSLGHSSTAAIWIETWARDDLEAPLLAVRLTPPPSSPPSSRPRQTPTHAERLATSASKAGPVRHAVSSAIESLSADDDSSWRALRVAGCSTVGPTCIGAALRLADNQGFSHNEQLSVVDRRAVGLQATASVPLEVGMATLRPSVGVGIEWLETRRAKGNSECQPAPDGQCVLEPPFGVDDGFTRSSFEPHIEARLTMSFLVTRWLSVDLAGAVVLRPTANTRAVLPKELPGDDPTEPDPNDPADPGEPNDPNIPPIPLEALELPGEPTRALGVAIGLRISM